VTTPVVSATSSHRAQRGEKRSTLATSSFCTVSSGVPATVIECSTSNARIDCALFLTLTARTVRTKEPLMEMHSRELGKSNFTKRIIAASLEGFESLTANLLTELAPPPYHPHCHRTAYNRTGRGGMAALLVRWPVPSSCPAPGAAIRFSG